MNRNQQRLIGRLLIAIGGTIVGAKATGLVSGVPEWLAWIGLIAAAIGPVLTRNPANNPEQCSYTQKEIES